MTIIDGFGVWEPRGNISPTTFWQSFPLAVTTPNSVFRIVYYSSSNFGFRECHPWGFIRGEYFTGTQILYDQNWLKIIPKDEPEIFSYPYPPDLLTEPLAPRNLQLKLSSSSFALRCKGKWSAQLYEKINSNVVYPTSPAGSNPDPVEA